MFWVGVLSAQNLNFKDTNALKTLLRSHTWIRYAVNPDSSFSDRIMDSIKFYENGSWFQSARPKDDTIGISFWPETISGNWRFVSTAKISRDDSASDCIALRIIPYANGQGFYDYLLVDWHRIKGSRYGKATGNLNKPFISTRLGDGGIDWERHLVWQVPRKPKKH